MLSIRGEGQFDSLEKRIKTFKITTASIDILSKVKKLYIYEEYKSEWFTENVLNWDSLRGLCCVSVSLDFLKSILNGAANLL